jgi:hypothetical protein
VGVNFVGVDCVWFVEGAGAGADVGVGCVGVDYVGVDCVGVVVGTGITGH